MWKGTWYLMETICWYTLEATWHLEEFVNVAGYLAACNLHNLAPDSSDTWGHMAR